MSDCTTITCPSCGYKIEETFVEQKCPRCQSIIESKFVCGSCHNCESTINPSKKIGIINSILKILRQQ